MSFYKWRPSKTAKREFAIKMDEISKFCQKNGIIASSSNDSYYFTINGQRYRVSNHSIEASNRGCFNQWGEKVREEYHDATRSKDVIYIHASKTRIIDIYNNLKAGYKLNGRGEKI